MNEKLLKETLSDIRLNTMLTLEKALIPSYHARRISRCIIENLRLHIKRIHKEEDYAKIINTHLANDKLAQSGILCMQYIAMKTNQDILTVRKYLHNIGYLYKKHYCKDNIYLKLYSKHPFKKGLYTKYVSKYIKELYRDEIDELSSKIDLTAPILKKQKLKDLYNPNRYILEITMRELGYKEILHNKSKHYIKV